MLTYPGHLLLNNPAQLVRLILFPALLSPSSSSFPSLLLFGFDVIKQHGPSIASSPPSIVSLEGIIDFSTEPPLGTEQRSVAKDTFNRIVDYFNTDNPSDCNPYNRSQLIRLTYQYVLSVQSQDKLLRAFFQAITLSLDDESDFNFDELRPKFFGFADYLLDSFYLPR
ncbi:hypothetical protein CIB48_g10728 [Xylaria polymorpha]|nr:hypothetical protein CIB48_g10728 [Xylaria polymorpha]